MIDKIKQWVKVDNYTWSLRLFKLALMLLFTLIFLCFCGLDKEHPIFLFFIGVFTLDMFALLATI